MARLNESVPFSHACYDSCLQSTASVPLLQTPATEILTPGHGSSIGNLPWSSASSTSTLAGMQRGAECHVCLPALVPRS